jgi:hypothetical protein
MNTPIKGVVPQPGATLPYSEFSGRRMFPKRVLCAIDNILYFLFSDFVDGKVLTTFYR